MKKKRTSKRIVNKVVLPEFKVKKSQILIDFLIETFPQKSRNNIKSLLSKKLVLVNGAPVSQFDFELVKDDIIQISPVSVAKTKQKASKLNILYEDDDILVINKPSGLLSVATDKEKTITAYRLCLDYVQSKDIHNRVFVVHRIDKETSGVLMFTKSDKLRIDFQDSWNDLVKSRQYIALVEGKVEKQSDTIISWLRESNTNLMYSARKKGDGLKAITNYKVIKQNDNYSLLDVNIDSGRKNQIRVHMKDMMHPIVGDEKYGSSKDPIKRLGLHARKLVIKSPYSDEVYTFVANEPQVFTSVFDPKFVEPKPREEIQKIKNKTQKDKKKKK